MKVVLIFRDHRKKGKSIEALFRPLLEMQTPGLTLTGWEYNQDKSIIANITSLLREKADLYHITGDVNFIAPWLYNKRVLVTVHDIGRYKELKGWKKWLFGWIWLRIPFSKAIAVATVSNFTKADLEGQYPFVRQKLEVIPNGVTLPLKDISQRRFNATKPRLLQVGTAHNKNLGTVIRAVRDIPCTLVIVGELSGHQRIALQTNHIEFENHRDVDIPELTRLYQSADIVVFASTHEGFGMPVIEAQSLGKPVVTSAIASLPEVAGDGAILVKDPYDPDEIRRAIQAIRDDEKLRHALIERGYMNAKRFDYERMQQEYLALYKKLIRA